MLFPLQVWWQKKELGRNGHSSSLPPSRVSGTPCSPEKREKITLVLHASVYLPLLYVSQLETFCHHIYTYLFCFFQGEYAKVANAKRSAKRRVCSLVSVQVMKTPVKFAVNKEILVYPTETTSLVLRSISLTVGLAKEKKHRAPVLW